MVAVVNTELEKPSPGETQEQFLALLPQIRRQACLAFRRYRAEAREELVQEVIANAFRTWRRLVEQGKESVAYATPLGGVRHPAGSRRQASRH